MLVAAIASCLPEAFDVTGKRCSSDRLCGPGFGCVDDRCVALLDDGGVDPGYERISLLQNGDFEEGEFSEGGGPEKWKGGGGGVLSSETGVVYSGARSARLFKETVAGTPSLSPETDPVIGPPAGATYCASVWVRTGDAGTRSFRLQFRERDDAGATLVSIDSAPQAVQDQWANLRHKLVSAGYARLEVRLLMDNPRALEPAYADHFELWQPPSGLCR